MSCSFHDWIRFFTCWKNIICMVPWSWSDSISSRYWPFPIWVSQHSVFSSWNLLVACCSDKEVSTKQMWISSQVIFSLLTCTSPDNPTTNKWDVVDSQVGSAKAHIYQCTVCTCKLLFLCLLLVQAEARFGWGITHKLVLEKGWEKEDSTFIFPPSCLKVGTFKLKIHTWEFVRTNVNQ